MDGRTDIGWHDLDRLPPAGKGRAAGALCRSLEAIDPATRCSARSLRGRAPSAPSEASDFAGDLSDPEALSPPPTA
jgi:hypothetical protein